MTEIPALPEPEALAGAWSVASAGGGGPPCRAVLTAGAPPLELRLDPSCAGALGLADAVHWRPAPDGIAFAARSGATLAFFSREGSAYVARGRDGAPRLRLARDLEASSASD